MRGIRDQSIRSAGIVRHRLLRSVLLDGRAATVWWLETRPLITPDGQHRRVRYWHPRSFRRPPRAAPWRFTNHQLKLAKHVADPVDGGGALVLAPLRRSLQARGDSPLAQPLIGTKHRRVRRHLAGRATTWRSAASTACTGITVFA